MRRKLFRTAVLLTLVVALLCAVAGLFFVEHPRRLLFLLILACLVCLAVLVAWILSARLAWAIAAPLNRLDLERPLENEACEELAPLMGRIHQQQLALSTQLQLLRRKTGEFEQIIRHMKEGLVLLDSRTNILSINPAALQIFGADSACIGKSLLKVETSQQMRDAVNQALDKGHGAVRLERAGRQYQFDLSRITSDGAMAGAVVLAIDVTDEVNAEQTRREFTANVSHELKTPLQTIIGSAELLENGMVKQEDIPRFVGHIRSEAGRLVSLVEDIIRLSQLDEEVALPTDAVNLLTLCREVADQLASTAGKRQVALSVEGEDAWVQGVAHLLYEIVYNLCENGIKYNVPQGRVDVTVTGGAHPTLTVADTGIGIPPEHQARVFQRFYRVDKSHSKQSGGTGLGLSIVKHAVQHHGARLDMTSAPGAGTTITVTF